MALVEELGAHRLLHGTVSDQPFTALVIKDAEIGIGTHRVDLPDEALAFFDAETGVRV